MNKISDKCEKLIKQIYKIPSNEKIITKIYHIFNFPNLRTPQTKIFIYKETDLLNSLNLEICKDINIDISIPINLSEKEINKIKQTNKYGYDIFQKNSSFFNEFCTRFTSESNTDVLISDRQKDYFIDTELCEKGCNYKGYNIEKNQILCDCKFGVFGKKNNSFINTKESQYFIKYSNILVILCYKQMFKDYKTLNENMATYIFSIFIILIIFNQIYYIKIFYKFLLKIYEKIQKKLNLNKKMKSISIKKNDEIKESSEKNFIRKYKNGKKITKKNLDNFIFSYINYDISDEDYYQKSFWKAKINKRTFISNYIYFLKYNQLIVFTFFNNKDNNMKPLKISLFIFSFIMFITFNALFYTHSKIHNVYIKKNKYDFINKFPKILFSTICTQVINFILKYLALSQKKINQIINENISKKNFISYFKNLKKELKIKAILFFLFLYLFSLLFWFYLSCFCYIYCNIQINLLYDTLLSFALSMLYPFLICIIISLIRIYSIKKNNVCIYKLTSIFGK